MKINITSQRVYSFDENKPEYSSDTTKVYVAFDELFNRRVILKVIDFSSFFAEGKTNLMSEVIALSRAGDTCPNIPMVFDYWVDEDKKLFYVVMQLICGDSLRNKLSVTNRANFNRWMISLCETLHSLHNNHLIHKDIKPENIIITKSNQLYLIDFNISINNANLVEGTENYKAPEMKHAGITISRSQVDIFAIGVMMYEFYTGKLPLEGVDYGTKRFQLDKRNWGFFEEPIGLVPDMPRALNDVIKVCMERDPDKRYKKVSDLKNALKSVTGDINRWKNQ